MMSSGLATPISVSGRNTWMSSAHRASVETNPARKFANIPAGSAPNRARTIAATPISRRIH